MDDGCDRELEPTSNGSQKVSLGVLGRLDSGFDENQDMADDVP